MTTLGRLSVDSSSSGARVSFSHATPNGTDKLTSPNNNTIKIDNADWIHKQRLIGSYGHRAKHTTVSFMIDGEPAILIFGGQTDFSAASADNGVYIVKRGENGEWYCHSPAIKNPNEAPPRMRGHSAVFYDGRMIIFGGKNNLRYFNQIYVSDCEFVMFDSVIVTQL